MVRLWLVQVRRALLVAGTVLFLWATVIGAGSAGGRSVTPTTGGPARTSSNETVPMAEAAIVLSGGGALLLVVAGRRRAARRGPTA